MCTTIQGFGFGKGQGAARRNATGEADPQLLYYHQEKVIGWCRGFGVVDGEAPAGLLAPQTKQRLTPSLYTKQKTQTTEVASSVADATQFLRFNSQPRQQQPGMRVFDRVLDFPCIFDIKVRGYYV